MSAIGTEGASLRRLLPARAASELLAPFGRILVGGRLRLRRADGALHAEEIGESWREPHVARTWPLTVDTAEVGLLEVDPVPQTGAEEAAVEALHGALQRALAAAHAQRAMAGETLERYREIHLLYRVGDALAGTLDPVAVPRRVLAEARGVIDGDGGGVWLADEEAGGAAGARTRVVVEGRSAVDGDAARLRTRLADPELPAIVAAGPGAREHLLWAPMMAREACLGGVWLTRAGDDAVFTAGDLKLLTALATQAAAFLDNARLHQRALAQERLEQELRLAYEVQARLLPRETPAPENWSVAGFWRPAREVSGDFYDLLPLGDALGVVVADVADKGMPAALFMAVARSLLRAAATGGRSPAQTVADTNRLAALDASDGMFVTLWYGVLRPDGEVRYVNAGHNPPIVLRADGRVERLKRTGILVGWDADAAFGEAAVALAPGDLLVAFTDGVTEARDPEGNEFGEGRLLEVVTAHRHADAQAVLDAVRSALDAFVAGAPTHDDCTLVVARFRTPPGGG
ncbi:MAG: PP2C family protein-serine/threonine phosphatase [Trueperaceae bacterium]